MTDPENPGATTDPGTTTDPGNTTDPGTATDPGNIGDIDPGVVFPDPSPDIQGVRYQNRQWREKIERRKLDGIL